ncbi:MAG: UDP-N-acetylmuramate dehydrogenase [Eubacterium sp.]|nr:UDP-N-acetylmuramate dehydrogenase [Eubacterium sp.]
MNKENIKAHLGAVIDKDRILDNEPMKNHTSFKVGGPADFLVLPESRDELAAVLACCRENELPFYVMGNGSNLLVRDGGYRGVMIKTRQLDKISVDGEVITAEPGALLKDVAEAALAYSLTGMEFASGIPGSIGGAVVMNAGAYGGEMKDIISEIEVITETGEIRVLPIEDCAMGYRKSIVQENPWYVTRITLRLARGDAAAIKATMDDLNLKRKTKQPLEYPSAGSTFRRPEGYFAGKLVQDCGFKGYSVGGAQVSEKHSGFVINKDNATAADILKLIGEIQAKVKADFGVDMRTEVIVIGEPCD